jgi:hypothetical protein
LKWVKDLNNIAKEDGPRAYKKCTMSGKCKLKLQYYLTVVRMASEKQNTIDKCG